MPHEHYTIGCYLLDRLYEIGCHDMFGVPGDFNLRFLDDVMTHKMKWIGCANELNAAYAADGYGRVRGVACLLTTCGVGELSAINGVAGSASESVPVIHVTGAPATRAQGARMLIHHTLGDGKFDHFLKINAEISCAAALLTPENALTEIDRVLVEALYHKKPGYIALPTDLAEAAAHPPAGPLQLRQPELSKPSLAAFVEAAKAKISAAKKPAVMVGHLVERHQLGTTTDGFLRTSKLPFTLASLGKGAVEENVPNCLGTYFPGEVECASKSAMDDSDACILLGVQLTDGVTGNFRHKFELQNVIDVQPYYAKVGDHLYPQIPMKDALAALEAICAPLASKSPTYPAYEVFAGSTAKTLDTQHLWAEIQAGLQPRDIVVVDLGTSAFSSLLLRLPTGGKYFCQHMWASIGYSIPAALGAQIADPTRRVVSITGDGAAQMTIQEICTFATHQLHPVMFLINNDGYTIERYIRGENAIYNDIAPWNWLGLAQAFCPKANLVTKRIDQVGEVRAALQATTRTSLSFYEVMVGRMEGPVRSVVPLPLMAHPK